MNCWKSTILSGTIALFSKIGIYIFFNSDLILVILILAVFSLHFFPRAFFFKFSLDENVIVVELFVQCKHKCHWTRNEATFLARHTHVSRRFCTIIRSGIWVNWYFVN